MPHPDGGRGNYFRMFHTLGQAFARVGQGPHQFISTTGERIIAKQKLVRGRISQRITRTIEFIGERNRHGEVCHACWGFRLNCHGVRIGQCTQALDRSIT